ncbi:MAG: SLC13 family permease [Chloroflexota bacterium]
MPTPIIITLIILGVAVVLFITEWLSADLVALLTLSALALSGLVTPEEALSGFSNPAVVTVWAVFILSAGLSRTGVAAWLGRQVLKLGGSSEPRLLLVIMLTAAFLSAIMNNIGVTAMMLPVVLDICRRLKLAPSRLLLPLAFSSLLGGMITLIGTPPNILASNILTDFGFSPLGMFDFSPLGIIFTLTGILFISTIGRLLLPRRDMAKEFQDHDQEMTEAFAIEERLFVISIPENSALDGCSLERSRLGAILGLNVIGINRNGHSDLAPTPRTILHSGDRLLVTGRVDKLKDWGKKPQFEIAARHISINQLTSDKVSLVEITIAEKSPLAGKNLEQVSFRQQYGGIVLAMLREGEPLRRRLETIPLRVGDKLLLQVTPEQVTKLRLSTELTLSQPTSSAYHLDDMLLLLKVPEDSLLCNKTIAESHLGDAYRLAVLSIIQGDWVKLMPESETVIMPGDQLLVKGSERGIRILQALHDLEIDLNAHASYEDMETEQIGMLEVVLSPQSSLPGKTLRLSHFRERHGLSVLAIWRAGKTMRSGLRDLPLRFGDALLIFGPREKLRLLADEPDFIPLTERVQTAPRLEKAPLAGVIMLSVVIAVGLGWLQISIAAVIGATLMVLSGSLKISEAYRSIAWNAIFLIAGMLPLGIAMQTTGTAEFLAQNVISLVEPYGFRALIAGIFLLTIFASQVMPNAVVTVLMIPIALTTAQNLGYSPYAFAMVVAIGASASFLSPVGHPANILIMGPGGYRFRDYFKAGLPLVVIALLIVLFVLPVFWPVIV